MPLSSLHAWVQCCCLVYGHTWVPDYIPLLHAAVWLTLLPSPHTTVVSMERHRPPGTVWLRGQPVPYTIAVPMVTPGPHVFATLICVHGLHARGPLSTSVCSHATGTILLPMPLPLPVRCLSSQCFLGLHLCPPTQRRAAAHLPASGLLPATQAICQRA